MKTLFAAIGSVMFCGLIFAVYACHDGDGNSLGDVGQPCESPDDCYLDVDTEELIGDVVCMDEVEDGYCTHHCTSDADCCAAEGECSETDEDLAYVCGPFQSTGELYCFISCEGQEDGNLYCETWAHPDFICRSTGGGSENRKVCVPNG